MQTVILGAGYAGLTVALQMARKGLGHHVTLVNDRPYHQLTTQLHRVAAGTAAERDVLIPLERLLVGSGVRLCVARIAAIDPHRRHVLFQGAGDACVASVDAGCRSDATATVADADADTGHWGDGAAIELPYDRLVIALGSEPEYFGIPGAAEHTFQVQPVEAAMRVNAHIKVQVSHAAQLQDTHRKDALRVVVAGGGLAGVELAGELADHLPGQTAAFGIPRSDIEIVLVEAAPKILPGFAESFVQKTRVILMRKGVRLLEGTAIAEVTPEGAVLRTGELLAARTVVWVGGVRGNRLVEAALPTNPRGRAIVNEYLQAEGHPDVYVLGDTALAVPKGSDRPAAPTGQNAVLQAKVVAYNLWAKSAGLPLVTYDSLTLGTVVSVGHLQAVAEVAVGEFAKPQLTGLAAYTLKRASEMRYLLSIGA